MAVKKMQPRQKLKNPGSIQENPIPSVFMVGKADLKPNFTSCWEIEFS